jgi:CzcA family heavy metal efflux pump
MVDNIIRWSLENRLFIVAASVALIVWGGYETAQSPVDVFPDLTAPTVTVVAEAHGMAPEEVETLLTFPIETALNGAAGVRRVRSNTTVGISVINVDFNWDVDIYRARQVVSERLQLVSGSLPSEVEAPVMGPVTSIMGEILFVGLTSKKHTPMELRTVADWTIARRLLSVPGVAQVIPIGGDKRQFQVLLDPKLLDAFEISADEVAHALELSNQNTSAGFLAEGGQEHLIHGLGRVQGPDDIAKSMITMRDGLPVLVGDVGKVSIGAALKRGEGGINSKRGVVIGIRKQPGANTLKLTKEIGKVLDTLEESIPAGMVLNRGLFRQADFIQVAIDNVSEALRDGSILVVLVVLLFLFSFRATFITAMAIPLSLLTAILLMRSHDMEINTMTLGGMAIAVGALVDDAIIDVENVLRRLRQNALGPVEQRRTVIEVVFTASKEIRRSIVFATVIIVLVFSPLFFLSGVEGRLLRPLGFAYAISLVASLVVALTITPVLCSLLLPKSKVMTRAADTAFLEFLKRKYSPLLRWALARWRLTTGLATAALAIALLALGLAGRSFLPTFNEGALTVSAVTMPGTALAESDQLGRLVETILLDHPEVASTARRTGRAEKDEHSQAVNSSEVEVRLQHTERSEEEFLSALRRDLSAVPGANIVIGQPIEHRIDHMLSGVRAKIAVKIFGKDLHQLRMSAEEVRQAMESVEGVADLTVEQQTDIPFVTIRFKRGTIARYGLSIETIAHEIETAFLGRVVTHVLEGQALFDLVVRYDTSAVDSLESVMETRIGTPTGARIPLHVLAEVQRSLGPNLITRENVERKIVVMCNVSGRDLQSVVDDIRDTVARTVKFPPGYRVEYGGQFQSAQRATRILGAVGALVLVAIFILLIVALGSARDAGLVMSNLPLALIGGVVGVYLSGGVLSVASIIGFITLFGIATRNGIMLVTHFHHLSNEEGVEDHTEIVLRGSLERLAPILMTALASGLGLLPLALSMGQPGSEIQAPMALVILSGLVSSTALNMIVLPALYLRFGFSSSSTGKQH